MAATIRLTVITGPHRNQRFCFRDRTDCLLGRAPDCFVQLVGESRDQAISRHHCRLSIDPPAVSLQDLGSTNGTYLNGKNVAKLEESVADMIQRIVDGAVVLHDGDIVTVAGTSLRVDIVDCPPPGVAEPVWETGEAMKKNCPVSC